LDDASAWLFSYLEAQVKPILADGLLDICKRQPDDAVDKLAEYLFKRNLDVPHPNPTLR
jgi:hypothetical protein